MSSIVSKIADEIKLHGSWEAYCAFRDAGDPSPRTPLPVRGTNILNSQKSEGNKARKND